jgi:amino acid transporter
MTDGSQGHADSVGLGKAYIMSGIDKAEGEEGDESETATHHAKIGELAATAICGNDITASCFYVVGELAKNSGLFAPLCTVLSSITLFCFRGIYGEVVTALPLNGGIYNLLLNSTSKRMASVAACLTILSYTATGVVSAVTAANYLSAAPIMADTASEDYLVPLAVAILAFFAFLMILGMKESSLVASLLFVFHLSTLGALSVASIFHVYKHGLGTFRYNLKWEHQPPLWKSVFYGFSSAMLGVSGFETSANFVEEQAEGVFPRTLTNMWVSVSVINISLPILASLVLSLDEITGPEAANVLVFMADRVSGNLLANTLAIDALLVLSGSVLTSYVGVCGLVQRMAGDRCLPEYFSALNSCRGTPHWTILSFFGLCASLCVVMDGVTYKLAAVYSLAFLAVMALFAFCGIYMKIKRPTLPRQIITSVPQFLLGMALVLTAFYAVVDLHPEMLRYFWMYYGMTVLCVMIAFMRIPIFMGMLWMVSKCQTAQILLSLCVSEEPQEWIKEQIAKLWSLSVVYFTKTSDLSQLNAALRYIEENEEARHVRIVHVYPENSPVPYHFMECVHVLDTIYKKIRTDCIVVQGDFGPDMILHVADMTGVSPNCMFINCPKRDDHYPFSELGGVRVILNSEETSFYDRIRRDQRRVRRRSRGDSSENGTGTTLQSSLKGYVAMPPQETATHENYSDSLMLPQQAFQPQVL